MSFSTQNSPPVVSIVGRSGSGKTTFLEKLISLFCREGLKVGSVKHSSHPALSLDSPGKDTWRHIQAGSRHVIMVTPERVFSQRLLDREPQLSEILFEMRELDLVLVEGWARQGDRMVEVVSRQTGLEPVNPREKLIALVSELPQNESGLPTFNRNDIAGLADFLHREIGF